MAEGDWIWYWSIFVGLSIVFVYLSRKALILPRSHGFYRFFVFEGDTGIILLNVPAWVSNPWSWNQILSWAFLAISIIILLDGVHFFRKFGHASENEKVDDLTPLQEKIQQSQFKFEKTTSLVQTGLFKYIRHPMYSSLLFLGWGAFLKDISWVSVVLIIIVTIFVFLTARADERECIVKFGEEYKAYMQKTKRFIPFIL
ncbi:MAG TPA: isoprenylcysteine carboxylmethyltransferase family protein [Candidatus Lokiarchaeia archaeon]|nr:isoprenylcysteine carboxylmethyltransferase family protein [Candidatus Lokiarchaeia archaeon]